MLIGALTEVSYRLPDDASPEQWKQAVITLARMEHAVQWWLGDALLFGEGKFAEQAAELQTALEGKYNYGTLADFKWVAKAIAPERRHPGVKWSLHRVIAKLKSDVQIQWLEKAFKEKWTRASLCEELQKVGLLQRPIQVKQCLGYNPGNGQRVHCSGCKKGPSVEISSEGKVNNYGNRPILRTNDSVMYPAVSVWPSTKTVTTTSIPPLDVRSYTYTGSNDPRNEDFYNKVIQYVSQVEQEEIMRAFQSNSVRTNRGLNRDRNSAMLATNRRRRSKSNSPR